MKTFLQRFGALVLGVLIGFDRWRFRGSKRRLCYPEGVMGFLSYHSVLLKEFKKPYAKDRTMALCNAIEKPAEAAGIYRYLNNSKVSKEETALAIAQQHGKTQGLIAVLGCTEPCQKVEVRKNRQTKKLEVRIEQGKCLHYYHYYLDAEFGLRYTRLQSWFPFTMHVGLNGRDWLAQQMIKAGIEFVKKDNCFTWIEDFEQAQKLMDQQLRTDWEQRLEQVSQHIHPLFSEICERYPMQYYWTCQDSEWAMDLVFRRAEQLQRLYPQLVHLGMVSFSSPDVLRFLGKRVSRQGTAFGGFEVPISSDLKVRPNGVRIKHRYGANSIKLYDKAYDELGAVLRPEITISRTELFRVFRPKHGEPDSQLQWRTMRRGIADLHRRAAVSQQALDRYCSALAAVDDTTTLAQLTAAIECRVCWKGKSVRALHPFDPDDHALLKVVNRGEFAIHGLRNRDLQALLYPTPPNSASDRRHRSAAISRKLRLLRAHGLIRKLSHTHRYRVTDQGRLILNAILSAHRFTLQQLTAAA